MAQDNSQDAGMDVFFLLIGTVMFAVLFWLLFHVLIIKMYLTIWEYQSYVAGIFTDKFSEVPSWVKKVNPETLGFIKFAKAASVMGEMTNKITFVILCSIALYIYIKSPHKSYIKRHSMQSLMAEAVKEWPQIFPVIGLNLLKEDEVRIKAMEKEFAAAKNENRPPRYRVARGFDPSMSEWEFTRAYGLIDDFMILDSVKTEVVLIKQLGNLYSSARTMSPTRRVIFAMFILRIDRKLKEYVDIRNRVALSFNNKNYTLFNGHITIEEIDTIINKYKDHNRIERLRLAHAYQSTLLVSMLTQARIESGVLASADFIWLRPMDRTLWYALNQEGRRVAWPEAAGVRAHWLAEIAARRRMETPVVSEAVNALRAALISQPEINLGEE